MLFSILLLIAIAYIAYRVSPRERKEDAHIHGAGQIGLLAAVALFGVDYFTSFYYATGEMMSALHPYGLQKYAYIAAAFIAIANFIFGALYMFSLGVFNEGGGSYTASMRYLKPTSEPDRRGSLDPGLYVNHRSLRPVRRRPIAVYSRSLWQVLVAALWDWGVIGLRHLVSHYSRPGRIGTDSFHATWHLYHAHSRHGDWPYLSPILKASLQSQ